MSIINAKSTSLRSFTGTASLLAFLGVASLFGASTVSANEVLKETTPNRMTNELVMKINVKLGPPEDMGKGADGHRVNFPIVGGTFVGKGMKGVVIPGGADMSIERDDGVTLVEALYRLKTDDGQIIIIHNAGIWRPNAVGLAKKAKGEKLVERDYYCRTSPSFKTQPGKHAWLSDYIFVGSIDDVAIDEVLIGVYQVDGV